MVPARSHKISRASWYSGFTLFVRIFVYRALTFCGRPSQVVRLMFPYVLSVRTPDCSGLGSSLFARRYSGYRVFFLFLQVLRCFNSLGCLPWPICFSYGSLDIAPVGFSYSEIRVSMSTCDSARLFAACCVLLRLLAPRHSPHALAYLTYTKVCFDFLLLKNLCFLLLGKIFLLSISEKLIAYSLLFFCKNCFE